MNENKSELKVLMLSSDRNIAVPGSAVGERMKEYGALVEELHIVLLSDSSHGLKASQLSPNVWVYPTNSFFQLLRPLDAARLGKKVVFDRKFVRGKSVITADAIECGWAGLQIKRRWRLPLELQLHSDPFSPFFSGFQNRVRKFYAGRIFKKADNIRCVSRAVAQKAAERVGAEKVFVLPIYVDRERIESGQLAFDIHARYGWRFALLAVARLEPEKNLAFALRALARVRATFPDTGLVVVGRGSKEGALKSLADKLGLAGFVEFAGWQDDLASFYQSANLFVQTSLFEGYGLALVEAGLSGVPVVSTPVGVAQELTHGQELYLVNHNDDEALAGAIIDLLENNFKRENLKINLKRALEQKLISKKDYLDTLRETWGKTALKIT